MQISAPPSRSPATNSTVLSRRDGRFDLLLVGLLAFLTVVDLFAAQALLPSLVRAYGVSPSAMGLAVNACTLGMAAGALATAILGDRLPRRLGISVSLALLSIPTSLLIVAPNLLVFAGLRVVQGLAMSTAFTITLAHLAERYGKEKAPAAFAAYITGNVASNFLGRLLAVTLADHGGISTAFAGFAALNLAGALLAFQFVSAGSALGPDAGRTTPYTAIKTHIADKTMLAGFFIGFAILFAFIGIFTYINFILVAPPFSLGMMQLGAVYFVFVPSTLTTPLAGAIAVRTGIKIAISAGLGVGLIALPLLLVPRLDLLIIGMMLFAVGTFFAQAVTTGSVSRRAVTNKGAASGLYLSSYFLGGLAGTAIGGIVFEAFGWPMCVASIACALLAALVVNFRAAWRD